MTLQYRAAVLHAAQTPLSVETVTAADLKPTDVLVRLRAAGLCHTDLEVIEGSLRYPMPIVLGHEAAGVVEQVGAAARGVKAGDHVVLSWNPHCGQCFYCDRDAPILCDEYLGAGPKARAFDGESRSLLADGRELRQLMFMGAFGEYCIVSDQQAIPVPKEIPFDRACLLGCGVMTGVGAALNLGAVAHGDTVMVVGCGAVGLAAVQGARLAGAGAIIAVDLDPAKLALAQRMGATLGVDASKDDVIATAKRETAGRGADVVIESAGSASAFRVTSRVSLGFADAGETHPPRQLWQCATAPRFSTAGAGLSRRFAADRRIDLPPHCIGGDQRRFRCVETRRNHSQRHYILIDMVQVSSVLRAKSSM
jgi:S-(hydroxymethyl)glutathione dehydrogenase/alcohol dehydrogenase